MYMYIYKGSNTPWAEGPANLHNFEVEPRTVGTAPLIAKSACSVAAQQAEQRAFWQQARGASRILK